MEKRFDSVKMTREIRDRNREKTKAKSYEERELFYKKKAAAILNVNEKPPKYNS
jgi:hypothetical protein